MWQSLWKPSPSRKKVENDKTSECRNNECIKETSKNGHQLSQMTIKGQSSSRGMVSSLYISRNSTSVLNGASFIASTPASSMIHNAHDSEIASNSSQSTSYNNFQHNELQTSTQIENIQSGKQTSSTYKKKLEDNVNELSSLSETPSHFQLPVDQKESSKNVSILFLLYFERSLKLSTHLPEFLFSPR